MLIKANNTVKNKILDYLISHVEECLYLYIDIENYSIESDTCQVFYEEENGNLIYVLMRYYDSYQLYSERTGYVSDEIIEQLEKMPGLMISGRKDLIEAVENKINGYVATYGYVFEMNRSFGNMGSNTAVWAEAKDADEIADIIMTYPEFSSHFTKEVLKKQLIERMESGTGRSCIMKENGKIVAHSATYAESKNLAVVSGTVVHEDFRNTDYFLRITTMLQSMLASEGKKAYVFAVNEKLINYHKRIHRTCGEYGKLEKIK